MLSSNAVSATSKRTPNGAESLDLRVRIRQSRQRVMRGRVLGALEWFGSITGVQYAMPRLNVFEEDPKKASGWQSKGLIEFNYIDTETVAHEVVHHIRDELGLDRFNGKGLLAKQDTAIFNLVMAEACAGLGEAFCHEDNRGMNPIWRLYETDYLVSYQERKAQAMVLHSLFGVLSKTAGGAEVKRNSLVRAVCGLKKEIAPNLPEGIYPDHVIGYGLGSLLYLNNGMDVRVTLKDLLTLSQRELVNKLLLFPPTADTEARVKELVAAIEGEGPAVRPIIKGLLRLGGMLGIKTTAMEGLLRA